MRSGVAASLVLLVGACLPTKQLPIDASEDSVRIVAFLSDGTLDGVVMIHDESAEDVALHASDEALVFSISASRYERNASPLTVADLRDVRIRRAADAPERGFGSCGRCMGSPFDPRPVYDGDSCPIPVPTSSVVVWSDGTQTSKLNPNEPLVAQVRADVRIDWPGECACPAEDPELATNTTRYTFEQQAQPHLGALDAPARRITLGRDGTLALFDRDATFLADDTNTSTTVRLALEDAERVAAALEVSPGKYLLAVQNVGTDNGFGYRYLLLTPSDGTVARADVSIPDGFIPARFVAMEPDGFWILGGRLRSGALSATPVTPEIGFCTSETSPFQCTFVQASGCSVGPTQLINEVAMLPARSGRGRLVGSTASGAFLVGVRETDGTWSLGCAEEVSIPDFGFTTSLLFDGIAVTGERAYACLNGFPLARPFFERGLLHADFDQAIDLDQMRDVVWSVSEDFYFSWATPYCNHRPGPGVGEVTFLTGPGAADVRCDSAGCAEIGTSTPALSGLQQVRPGQWLGIEHARGVHDGFASRIHTGTTATQLTWRAGRDEVEAFGPLVVDMDGVVRRFEADRLAQVPIDSTDEVPITPPLEHTIHAAALDSTDGSFVAVGQRDPAQPPDLLRIRPPGWSVLASFPAMEPRHARRAIRMDLAEGPPGEFWIGAVQGELYRFAHGRLTPVPVPPDDPVTDEVERLTEDHYTFGLDASLGVVWAGGRDRGLHRMYRDQVHRLAFFPPRLSAALDELQQDVTTVRALCPDRAMFSVGTAVVTARGHAVEKMPAPPFISLDVISQQAPGREAPTTRYLPSESLGDVANLTLISVTGWARPLIVDPAGPQPARQSVISPTSAVVDGTHFWLGDVDGRLVLGRPAE